MNYIYNDIIIQKDRYKSRNYIKPGLILIIRDEKYTIENIDKQNVYLKKV